jgi:hypothetical protein
LQRSQHGISLSRFALLKCRIRLLGLGPTQSTPSGKQLKQTVKFLIEFGTRREELLIARADGAFLFGRQRFGL